MTTHDIVESYSRRLLSPFSGTARIIQQQQVRAISNDGVNWRILIQTAAPGETLKRYALFGLWTRRNGLKEFPLHPQQASPHLRQIACDFVQQLSDWSDKLSFPLIDTMECWLLDQEQQPLALLISCQLHKPLTSIRQPVWLPSAPNDHTFVSMHLQQPSQPHNHSTTPIYHRDLVAQRVHEAAGQHRQIQWFQRQADNSGIGQPGYLETKNMALRHLPAEAFPHYLLRQYWPDENTQQLINDFFHWQSPWLLTLPDLSKNERQLLETQACNYPPRLHALYHLYPTLLQKELINKTLVQAKLEKTLASNAR